MRLWRSDRERVVRAAALQPPRRQVLEGAPQGDLRALPNAPADTGVRADPGVELRPEALGVALYVGAQVRPPLRITRADDGGWTFRVSRRYASRRQALAFQYVLDRLQVLNAIVWSRTARTIRVTATRDAAVLEPLLDRLP
jgi:hypothetical protein